MKQSDWKIIYTNYSGVAKKAINFLSKEAGAYIIREPNVYRIHVLPCEKEGCALSKNTFFVSLYDESSEIQKHVSRDERPEDGFLVKVIGNPDAPDGRLVILTAHSDVELFYAAVSFIDDYIPAKAPNRMADLFFDEPIKEGAYTETPDNKTRSIFTWGHSFNDYRAYIDNMARLKFNELIVWNDYIPVNINDIVSYAHSYGIKFILGYSWGWKEIGNKVKEITEESIRKVKEIAIREYRDNYSKIECDGVYFQSFTERKEESVGGKLISRLVVDMVNEVANELWKMSPSLRIIFGLHASSVKNRLDEIARVDDRMEIMWEDCGEYPYSYSTRVQSEELYKETLEFTKKMLNLRGGRGVGLVFKGVMMLDWTKFINQRGPYVMGENTLVIANHDRQVRRKGWRSFSADWIKNGNRAQEMLKYIKDNKLGEVDMCLAGTFDGGIYLPVALCAQMYRRCEGNYYDIVQQVIRRSCVELG